MWNKNGLRALITAITRETKTVYMRWSRWPRVKQKRFICVDHGDHTWNKSFLPALIMVITRWNKNGLHALMTVIIRETKTVYVRWSWWSYVKQRRFTCVDHGDHTWNKNFLPALIMVITRCNKNGLHALMTVIIRESKTIYMRRWRWSYVKQKRSTCVDDGDKYMKQKKSTFIPVRQGFHA